MQFGDTKEQRSLLINISNFVLQFFLLQKNMMCVHGWKAQQQKHFKNNYRWEKYESINIKKHQGMTSSRFSGKKVNRSMLEILKKFSQNHVYPS